MLREDLEVLFCFKIGKELEQFKVEIEKMDLDEILARAYQVDTMITIYELLLEMSQQLGKEILETIILYPNLLAFLYEKWMKEEDSHMQATLNINKESWLQYRKQGIGGSDAGAVCGLNPYRTAIQVYYDKTSDSTEGIDNEAMRQGRELEEYVARRFCEASGKKVRRANAMFYDEKNPFMLADVDRMIVGENAGLECKTASPYSEEKWRDDKVPLSYQLQCYHYMSVCNADAWYIAVLIYGRDFKYYKIERDDEVIENLIRIEKEFWNEYVLKQMIPDPDGSRTADAAIAERFKESKQITIPLSGFDERLERRQELSALLDKIETEKRQIDQELKLYLGNAEIAENEHYRISWKNFSRSSIDEKRLKAEQPEIYEKYRREITSRRFTVKAA